MISQNIWIYKDQWFRVGLPCHRILCDMSDLWRNISQLPKNKASVPSLMTALNLAGSSAMICLAPSSLCLYGGYELGQRWKEATFCPLGWDFVISLLMYKPFMWELEWEKEHSGECTCFADSRHWFHPWHCILSLEHHQGSLPSIEPGIASEQGWMWTKTKLNE